MTNIFILRMLPIDVRLEGPSRMFDHRPLFFNLYMGPNLFHDMWAPRCVVCSTLICWSDRKSTRLNSSHMPKSRMPSSA